MIRKILPILTSLVFANALALGVLMSPTPATAGDFCPNGADGCKCWDGAGISPPGCYENAAPVFECHGADWCEVEPD